MQVRPDGQGKSQSQDFIDEIRSLAWHHHSDGEFGHVGTHSLPLIMCCIAWVGAFLLLAVLLILEQRTVFCAVTLYVSAVLGKPSSANGGYSWF